MSDREQEATRAGHGQVRWSLVVLCILLGLGLLATAWWLSDPGNSDAQPAFWSGVLVNVGSAILLAAFIYWLERSFVRATRGVARQAAQEAAQEVATTAGVIATEAAQKVTAEFTTKLESLQEQIAKRRDEASEEAATVFRNLDDSTSWRAMFDALMTAQRINAIGSGVTVLAGNSPRSPLVTFIPYQDVAVGQAPAEDGIRLELASLDAKDGESLFDGPSAIWTAEITPVDAFHALEESSIKMGHGALGPNFDVSVLVANLRDGLADAIAGRRTQADAWRGTATVRELWGPDWALSDAGVEQREHGLVITQQDLGNLFARSALTMPGWADRDFWDLAVKRGTWFRI